AGAIQKTEYLEIVKSAGFKYIIIQDEKPINYSPHHSPVKIHPKQK
ncbi:unnamed protein product, partial [marine sediment metagenome]